MKRTLILSGALFAGFAALQLSIAHPAVAGDAKGLHVVELFTSQSCYSCPPAEQFLGELAARDDLVALELHVDYWDDLAYGSAGKWKDVFSDPAFTERQRGYSGTIPGSQTYTPQMVIDGRIQMVGSRRGAVNAALSQVAARGSPAAVSVVPAGRGAKVVVSAHAGAEADIWVMRYELKRETRVRAGENKGKVLVNHNIVRSIDWLGRLSGVSASYTIDNLGLGANQGCAVIVQAGHYGPIIGAAKCPAAPDA